MAGALGEEGGLCLHQARGPAVRLLLTATVESNKMERVIVAQENNVQRSAASMGSGGCPRDPQDPAFGLPLPTAPSATEAVPPRPTLTPALVFTLGPTERWRWRPGKPMGFSIYNEVKSPVVTAGAPASER